MVLHTSIKILQCTCIIRTQQNTLRVTKNLEAFCHREGLVLIRTCGITCLACQSFRSVSRVDTRGLRGGGTTVRYASRDNHMISPERTR